MTSEQPEQWLVNDATGGGWTVSQHTEEHYIEFVLYDRREADELALMLAERDALAQKLAAAAEKAALADEAQALMDGWQTPFVIGDGSMDAEAEYERGTQRLVTDTKRWLARIDALTPSEKGD